MNVKTKPKENIPVEVPKHFDQTASLKFVKNMKVKDGIYSGLVTPDNIPNSYGRLIFNKGISYFPLNVDSYYGRALTNNTYFRFYQGNFLHGKMNGYGELSLGRWLLKGEF